MLITHTEGAPSWQGSHKGCKSNNGAPEPAHRLHGQTSSKCPGGQKGPSQSSGGSASLYSSPAEGTSVRLSPNTHTHTRTHMRARVRAHTHPSQDGELIPSQRL